MNEEDRIATINFHIRDRITGYCGQRLTPDTVDVLVKDIQDAIAHLISVRP